MFLQQTMNPWFAVHRASQVTMIVLAVAMLILPISLLTEESDGGLLWAGVTIGVAIIGGICYIIANSGPTCSHCGEDDTKTTDHEYTCSLSGCNYQWNCLNRNSHSHCNGPCDDVNVDHSETCWYCNSPYYICGSSPHASGECSE